MNGNPTSKQKEFHNDLREMYLYTQMENGTGELHHIMGSKFKAKLLTEAGIKKSGEWLVLMIPRSVHLKINECSFEEEREMFLQQQVDYENYFGRPSPVPQECIDYYNLMKSKHQGVKSWYVV